MIHISSIEHPGVSQVRRTGYPEPTEEQEHAGIDAYGTELYVGDEVVFDSNTGEFVHIDNLKAYLTDRYQLEFKEAE